MSKEDLLQAIKADIFLQSKLPPEPINIWINQSKKKKDYQDDEGEERFVINGDVHNRLPAVYHFYKHIDTRAAPAGWWWIPSIRRPWERGGKTNERWGGADFHRTGIPMYFLCTLYTTVSNISPGFRLQAVESTKLNPYGSSLLIRQ